jgi:hypothetical protein
VRKLLLATALFLASICSAFAADVGITPCVPGSQPPDLAFSTTSAEVQLSTCGETVIVYNNSANDARYRLGTSNPTTAVLTDSLLPANSFVVLNVGRFGLYFAAISTGTGTISFVQGSAYQ